MDRKRECLLMLGILILVTDLHGQVPQPRVENTEQRLEAERRINAERELRMRNMREFDTTMKPLTKPRPSVPASPTIDKETSERIQLARRVDPADHARYSRFLEADKTGMFKLFPDYDCVTENVVRTDGACANFIMASSSFSFRTGGYIHPLYHDLGFDQGVILNNAFFAQGIFVSLGDVPIEEVTPSHDALKFIYDLDSATAPAAAKKAAARFRSGVEFGGYAYSDHIKPAENTTYALRSVAYDVANSLPMISEKTSASEIRFHTLALDKRADVIVVFRIVRVGADGSLTIVWKELDRKEAPKIKFGKGEKFIDFRSNIGQVHQ